MSMLMEQWPHKWFGYFGINKAETPHLPLLKEAVDVNWNPPDKVKLVNYLRTAPVAVCAGKPPIKCPLCGQEVGRDGSAHQSDNVWLWPEDLYHLVEAHSVMLPNAFAEHIRKNKYAPPKKLTIGPDDVEWPKAREQNR